MGRTGRFPGMTYEIRQEPEQLAFGIPSDWNTRPRLTLWMAFLVGFVATMVVVGGCFMMAEGLILNGLLVIVLGLIAASPLVWRRLPHRDVLLRRPDAQEADLGIAFDQPRWRGGAAAALSAVLGLLIVAGGVKTLAEGFADVNGSQLANLIQGSIAGVLGGGLVAFGIVSARGWRAEPDRGDVVLTARGVRMGDHRPLIAWDDILRLEPTIDVIPAGKAERRVPRIKVQTATAEHVIDVNLFRQHPVAMLNILEFYRANPKRRVEVGMEASVLRARRITAAVDPRAWR